VNGIDPTTLCCAVDGCPDYSDAFTKDGRAMCHAHRWAEMRERWAQQERTRNRIAHQRRRAS
jgi:hypothetical protein